MRSRRCQSFNTQRYARHLRRGPTTASITDICLAPIPIDAFDARHIRSMAARRSVHLRVTIRRAA
jgi:hypothetical protein